jgi:hypothetical protein
MPTFNAAVRKKPDGGRVSGRELDASRSPRHREFETNAFTSDIRTDIGDLPGTAPPGNPSVIYIVVF